VASIDEEGFVYIQDRIKDMIISGGENVYPAEIENVILSHPDVIEVAVIGQPSQKWGESPFAIVVPKSSDVAADAILSFCDGKLARFKLPRGLAFTDVIPRNANGKVLKRVLRESYPGPAPQ
jgi:acyl-CoA synthetase (AMP-forming)/AMP-acid ligase II